MKASPAIPGLSLLGDSPHAAYAVDLDQTVRFWNRSAERITGHKAENVIGRHCYEVLQNCSTDREDPMCREGCPLLEAIHENLIPQAYKASMLCASGQRKAVVLTPMVVSEPPTFEVVLLHLFHEPSKHEWEEQSPQTIEQALTADCPFPKTSEQLTPREIEVLRLTARGMPPREIAGELHISYHTVTTPSATTQPRFAQN